MAVLSAIIMFTGCQDEPNPVESTQDSNQPGLFKFSLPAGATFVSATFYINVLDPTSQNIDVHRITNPWEEMTVTWNNFGGAYAPAIEGTFNVAAVGWNSVDVTSLVGSWLDGTSTNYGLLLAQDDQTYPRTRYSSRESIYDPYLEICYTENGGPVVCDTTRAIGDAYIYELKPDQNTGWYYILYTGWGNATDLEKQALVKFDLEYSPPPQVDCETAYAWGEGLATCFLDIPGVKSNNWGWSNGAISDPSSYSWDIYAGAGQCDITKGTLVGTLDVDYSGGTVTVAYNIDPDFTLDETHLYVGDEMLARKKGKFTTAPGQFPYSGQQSYTIDGLSGDIYVVAHSVVCGDYN